MQDNTRQHKTKTKTIDNPQRQGLDKAKTIQRKDKTSDTKKKKDTKYNHNIKTRKDDQWCQRPVRIRVRVRVQCKS